VSVSILMVGSEALPFSKTGGLADVLGALPHALARLEHRVSLVIPRYHGVQVNGTELTVHVPLAGAPPDTRVIEQPLGPGVRVIFIDRPDLYDRESLYGAGGSDYPDNARRFGFLARAALEYALLKAAAGDPFDLVHAHDWQAGLCPVYLRTVYQSSPIGSM